MKNRSVVLFAALTLLVVLSCDKGTEVSETHTNAQAGSLFFSLQASSIPTNIKVITAKLERTGYQTITDSVIITSSADVKLRINNITPGTWTLTVQAKDSTSQVKYKGSASVTILENQTVQVSVLMSPTSSGSLEIGFVWGPVVKKWMMHAENPIFTQTPGTWDANHFFFDDPAVLKIGNTYHIWYSSAYSQSVNGRETFWIAHATSSDGIHWTKYGPVINPGPVGSWMEKGADGPTVVYDNGIYKMWFTGVSNTKYHNGVGYATSTDGNVWAVNPQPVIPVNNVKPTTWSPCVIKNNNIYYMYLGVSPSSTIACTEISLMTSLDGINWSDQGVVLSARLSLSWQREGIVGPQVLIDGNKFKMFYSSMSFNTASIGYAESLDGIHWNTTSDLPSLTNNDTSPWTTSWVAFPAVLKEDGKFKMWFSALTAQPYRWQIGYAEQSE